MPASSRHCAVQWLMPAPASSANISAAWQSSGRMPARCPVRADMAAFT